LSPYSEYNTANLKKNEDCEITEERERKHPVKLKIAVPVDVFWGDFKLKEVMQLKKVQCLHP